MAEAASTGRGAWRGIDELAELVGAYCWVEHRIFELTGAWASAAADGEPAGRGPELRVWCAAVSGHHGAVAGCWAARLPVRAAVDPVALVTAPVGPLPAALDALAAQADLRAAVATLVWSLFPRLKLTYLAHLRLAAPVREAPVMEVLAGALRLLTGEIHGGRPLVEGFAAGLERGGEPGTGFERAFEETSVFPAVRPS